jgi:hypothetical protein
VQIFLVLFEILCRSLHVWVRFTHLRIKNWLSQNRAAKFTDLGSDFLSKFYLKKSYLKTKFYIKMVDFKENFNKIFELNFLDRLNSLYS